MPGSNAQFVFVSPPMDRPLIKWVARARKRFFPPLPVMPAVALPVTYTVQQHSAGTGLQQMKVDAGAGEDKGKLPEVLENRIRGWQGKLQGEKLTQYWVDIQKSKVTVTQINTTLSSLAKILKDPSLMMMPGLTFYLSQENQKDIKDHNLGAGLGLSYGNCHRRFTPMAFPRGPMRR